MGTAKIMPLGDRRGGPAGNRLLNCQHSETPDNPPTVILSGACGAKNPPAKPARDSGRMVVAIIDSTASHGPTCRTLTLGDGEAVECYRSASLHCARGFFADAQNDGWGVARSNGDIPVTGTNGMRP